MLQMNGFQKDEISAFTMDKGCLRGKTDGIPLSICNLGSLPKLDLPVILSIDVSYFPLLTSEFNIEKIIGSLKFTYDSLFPMKYKIQDAVVSYSVNGGITKPFYSWVGGLAIEFLRNPVIIKNPEPPEYYTVLQTAETLRVQNKPQDSLKHLVPLLEKDKHNPSILMYVADAYLQLGEIDKSFELAESACRIHLNYCYILPELGMRILYEGKLEKAERFFLTGYDINTEMDYMQLLFAHALKKAGRYKDALKYYETYGEFYGPWPADFFIGEVYFALGDKDKALEYYNSGREELLSNPYALPSRQFADTLYIAIKFYELEGHMQYAKDLRQSPKLKKVFEDGRLPDEVK